jgi:hypothetical protein
MSCINWWIACLRRVGNGAPCQGGAVRKDCRSRLEVLNNEHEYPLEDPPPKAEGAPITHAETSETPGFFRMYFFYPEEHPDMYHFDGVVRQQTVQTAVEIFHLVHG